MARTTTIRLRDDGLVHRLDVSAEDGDLFLHRTYEDELGFTDGRIDTIMVPVSMVPALIDTLRRLADLPTRECA